MKSVEARLFEPGLHECLNQPGKQSPDFEGNAKKSRVLALASGGAAALLAAGGRGGLAKAALVAAVFFGIESLRQHEKARESEAGGNPYEWYKSDLQTIPLEFANLTRSVGWLIYQWIRYPRHGVDNV